MRFMKAVDFSAAVTHAWHVLFVTDAWVWENTCYWKHDIGESRIETDHEIAAGQSCAAHLKHSKLKPLMKMVLEIMNFLEAKSKFLL